jgi:hypothetical protein
MPPQTGLGTAELTNTTGPQRAIEIHWDLRDIEYRAFGSILFCGSPSGTPRRDASYTGSAVIAAKRSGHFVDLEVSGR